MVAPHPDFRAVYSGKRVFLTGHTGFKGSWLTLWLHRLGAEVKGYALAPEGAPNHYEAIGGDALCTSVIADIRDADRLRAELTAFRPDVVFHLAAQPLVRRSYTEPVETVATNALGTVHLLEALRGLAAPCSTVVVTTDKVYANREAHYAYREGDALGGYDPYSASKACTEILAASWRSSFFHLEQISAHGQSIATGRAGNVIGGGDWAADRIIPDAVRALEAGAPLQLRNPGAVRPWQHVLESLYGYLLLAARQAADGARYADAFNFGPGAADEMTVRELADIAVRAWGSGSVLETPDGTAPHEAGLLMLDNGKALRELGWRPQLAAEEAIHLTIDWYKRYSAAPAAAREVTSSQIAAYEARLPIA